MNPKNQIRVYRRLMHQTLSIARLAFTCLCVGIFSLAQNLSFAATETKDFEKSTNNSEQKNLPTPQEIRQDWKPLGQGEMRWLGLRLYHASLWTPTGTWAPNQPFALELRYARDIAAHRLVDTSLDEIKRLHVNALDEALQQRWSKHLQLIFPDVKAGDVIIGISLPDQGAAFFHQNRLIGQINEPEFAEKFFAIWLSPETREPRLRRQLLRLN
ncbi:MAG: chalcone isomerase family protein [Rugosibacter sp.]|nr:chalcone isomerase family protein [Rugosibacter sp.]